MKECKTNGNMFHEHEVGVSVLKCDLYLIGEGSSSDYKCNAFVLYLVHIYLNSVRL